MICAPGVHRAGDLRLGVALHDRGQPDRAGPLDERYQRVLLQGGDDQQDEIGAVGEGFPQLVARDDEVLAQQRHVHRAAASGEILERTSEAVPLGEDGHDGRAPALVFQGESGRVGDRREGALARA